MTRRLHLLTLLTLLTVAPLAAQEVSMGLTRGYLMANSSRTSYISTGTYGIEASLGWQCPGSTYWMRYWRQPTFGLRASYAHITHGIAGDRWGLLAFMQNPITTHASLDIGVGLSCYPYPCERTADTANEFIGSYLNCIIEVGLQYNIPLADNDAFLLTAKMVHSSNGYLQKPNQGLNFLQAGVAYQLPCSHTYAPRRHEADTAFEPHTIHFLSYAPGLVMPRYTGSRYNLFYTHTAQLGWLYQFHPCLAAGANVDLMYNYSHNALIRFHHDPYPIPLYVGGSAILEPSWGPLSMRLSLGCYLLKSQQVTIPLYERVGFYYHFGSTRQHYAGVTLKSHYAHIDYIEWTYGFKLKAS